MQHMPETCYGSKLHCYSHNEDEPDNPCYRACFECRHVFPTAEDLLREHNEIIADLNKYVVPGGDSLWVLTEPMPPETDPLQVFTCPHCVHDF